MKNKSLPWKAFGCFLISLFAGSAAQAADRQLQLKWSQLAQEITGRKISAMPATGALIEGRVVSVGADALIVNGPKGNISVPRNQVTSVRVSRPGWKWRVIGPIVGLVSFGIAGAFIGDKINPDGFIVSDGAAHGATVGVIAGAGAGYIAGHFADRHHTVIQIIE
ncbi:MAG: hypothetical protein ABI811_00430 [Acidobacteriota bacterium]